MNIELVKWSPALKQKLIGICNNADGTVVGNISIEQKTDMYCRDGEIGLCLLTNHG